MGCDFSSLRWRPFGESYFCFAITMLENFL
jgi:hypothetical protein